MSTKRVRHIRPKMTRHQQIADNKRRIDYHQAGTGWHRFRMRSKEAGATLTLSKPGKYRDKFTTQIGPYNPKDPTSGEWEGDSYFMEMVKSHEAFYVCKLDDPAVPVPVPTPEEEVMTENQKSPEELILDQPDTFTQEGKVEHVVAGHPGQQPLNEVPLPTKPGQEPETLITEDPLDGVEIILD